MNAFTGFCNISMYKKANIVPWHRGNSALVNCNCILCVTSYFSMDISEYNAYNWINRLYRTFNKNIKRCQ